MWIFTEIGYFSIVAKPWDRETQTLTIRARVKDDLEALRAFLPSMGDVVDSSGSDYRFRAVAPREDVAEAIRKLTAEIDYDNFKEAVANQQGRKRASLYGEIWNTLLRLQVLKKPKGVPPILITALPTHGAHSKRRGTNDTDTH